MNAQNCRTVCVENLAYSGVDLIAGQSAALLCNTSLTPDIMWTYDTAAAADGYVDYVYWNERFDRPRLSVEVTAAGSHSLIIAGVQPKDSGLYDCYDAAGMRQVGHRLTVAGIM